MAHPGSIVVCFKCFLLLMANIKKKCAGRHNPVYSRAIKVTHRYFVPLIKFNMDFSYSVSVFNTKKDDDNIFLI